MKETENYSFEEPDKTDFYNVEVYNTNLEALDAILKQIVDLVGDGNDYTEVLNAIAEVKTSLGANTDNANSLTCFGVVNTIYTLVQQLRNVITDNRASKLDNLDAKLSDLATATALASVKSIADNINANAARMTSTRAAIIDSIGATTNTGGSASAGTLNAKVNACITSLTTLASAVASLQTNVTALQTKVNAMPTSFIKSVQRGFISEDMNDNLWTSNIRYKDITINEVNTSKAFVIVNTSAYMSGTRDTFTANAQLLNSTTLRIYAGEDNRVVNMNWQVVEFN